MLGRWEDAFWPKAVGLRDMRVRGKPTVTVEWPQEGVPDSAELEGLIEVKLDSV